MAHNGRVVYTGFTTLQILFMVLFLCHSPLTIWGKQNPEVEGMGAKERQHHGMCILSLAAPLPDLGTPKRRISKAVISSYWKDADKEIQIKTVLVLEVLAVLIKWGTKQNDQILLQEVFQSLKINIFLWRKPKQYRFFKIIYFLRNKNWKIPSHEWFFLQILWNPKCFLAYLNAASFICLLWICI